MAWPIDVVIVHYRAPNALANCLKALRPWRDRIGGEVLVVNNSPPATIEDVNLTGTTILQNSTNLGYAIAVQQAGLTLKSPGMLLLRPQAQLEAGDAALLVERLTEDGLTGAVGPRFVDLIGRTVPHDPRTPTMRRQWLSVFGFDSWSSAWARFALRAARRPRHVGWLRGECLLVRRRVFDDLGGIDRRFHLFYEEVDLCQRMQLLGYHVVHEPRAVCTLLKERPRGEDDPNGLSLQIRNELAYLAKHYPDRWLHAHWLVFSRIEVRWSYWQILAKLGGEKAEAKAKAYKTALQAVRMFNPAHSAPPATAGVPSNQSGYLLDASDLDLRLEKSGELMRSGELKIK